MKPINVTQSFLPPVDDYISKVKEIWNSHWLTNHGPLVGKFENGISSFLGLTNSQYVTNGTIALQIAIKALELKGEVITTPFSFIATSSSLVWESCRPVFADIDERTFNIDISNIESLITDKTTAILVTHVYGNPCDIDEILTIARRRNLKVIFDAAHCFGVKYKDESVLNFGDVSMLSLHATKLFHSTEGGLLVTKNKELHRKMWLMKNFGFEGEENISTLGINGKNSEFHAAMGLCNLLHASEILNHYKENYLNYRNNLEGNSSIKFQLINPLCSYNYAYFPVLFENYEALNKVRQALKERNINTRRYFYPALNEIGYLAGQTCLKAESVAGRILCLPMSYYLTSNDIKFICSIMNEKLKSN